ncbi:conserved hypothetical protein [Denitrovibrio acetiphilus DSM 12809]|jgi:hypothetical protein|uniref:PIN domain-containing protein n=1 Tax=Denitrovibrio acetiphilus (strain DSM 12809 / NBRC 114555 / N2460) TaxID=522772 RepID=D4H4M9_DENA2|nr:hypothetical protein [Denitrovibrio acetiphilus]ADD67423.1 conserved hypothetical protein [Denitrovibrio acetiphilus DSM 12809]
MVLLSDASIIIDLEYVNALDHLPKVCECEVLDVVLEECDSPKQPGLVDKIYNSDIKVIETSMSLLKKAILFDAKHLSQQDKMIYMYAVENLRTVLSGDKALRNTCKENDIECHGLIWLMREFAEKGLVIPEEICKWFPIFRKLGRRLPSDSITELQAKLGC